MLDYTHDDSTAAGSYRIFTEPAAGALQSHPELDKLMDEPRPGDTLEFWHLDQLGRSIRSLIDQLPDLQDRGISSGPCRKISSLRLQEVGWVPCLRITGGI